MGVSPVLSSEANAGETPTPPKISNIFSGLYEKVRRMLDWGASAVAVATMFRSMNRLMGLAFFFLTVLLESAQAAHPHFTLPVDSFTHERSLVEFLAALDQRNDGADLTLLVSLLNEDGDKLRATEGGGLMSVAMWMEAIPAHPKAVLLAAYREKFDPGLREQVDLFRRTPDISAEAIYAFARRHRFSATSAAVYALAADRYLAMGDLSAAHALYQLAVGNGWIPDDTRAAQIETLRKYDEGHSIGALPFDALWFNHIATVDRPRFFPIAAADRVYFVSARAVFAVKENGQIAWMNFNPIPAPTSMPTPAQSAVDRIEESHRPASFTPSVLKDIDGRAQILVARQNNPLSSEKENDYRLCAYRASDGKRLWNSDDQPFLKDLSFAGTPAVCGGYTYAVALSTRASVETVGDRNVDLVMVAVDTLTGDFRWQATLGRFKLTVEERNVWINSTPWDEVWEQSEPLVVGDVVYVTPNAGFAAAIGRFDGKLRWIRPYQKAAMDSPRPPRMRADLQKQMEDRRRYFENLRKGIASKATILSMDPAVGERWRGTPVLCGDRLIVAPQDTLEIHGIDAATGRWVWTNKEIDAGALIGRTATTAIIAGSAITAINASTGRAGWRWEPRAPSRITGPAVMRVGIVQVPTTHGIVSINAEDGGVLREPLVAPTMRILFSTESFRRALNDAGMKKAFGLPPAP